MSEWETSLRNGNQLQKSITENQLSVFCLLIEISLVNNRTDNLNKKVHCQEFAQYSLFFNLYFWMNDLLTKYKQNHKQLIQKWKVNLLILMTEFPPFFPRSKYYYSKTTFLNDINPLRGIPWIPSISEHHSYR